jgi:hypothetical protein
MKSGCAAHKYNLCPICLSDLFEKIYPCRKLLRFVTPTLDNHFPGTDKAIVVQASLQLVAAECRADLEYRQRCFQFVVLRDQIGRRVQIGKIVLRKRQVKICRTFRSRRQFKRPAQQAGLYKEAAARFGSAISHTHGQAFPDARIRTCLLHQFEPLKIKAGQIDMVHEPLLLLIPGGVVHHTPSRLLLQTAVSGLDIL